MADEEAPICPNCKEEVEADWLKCPMCNFQLKEAHGSPPGPMTKKPVPSVAPGPVQGPSAGPKVEEDLKRSDEARRISEAAALKAKEEARVKELEAKVSERDDRISELERALEAERKRSKELEQGSKAVEATGADADEFLRQREKALEDKEAEITKMEEEALASVQDISDQRAQIEKDIKELKAQREGLAKEEARIVSEREKVKQQANALTVIEMRIEEHNKHLSTKEDGLAEMESNLERSKRELDTMIEKYGDKLTTIKSREKAVDTEMERLNDIENRLRTEEERLEELKGQLEREHAEVKDRSTKLFEKIKRVEEKGKEIEHRENDLSKKERKNTMWEEDLRQSELHLMSIQEEINDCVYCSIKDRFSSVDRVIKEAKALGADVDMAEDKVKAAKLFLDEGEFDKAVEKATEAINLAKQAKKQYYSYGVKYTIKTVEKIITNIKRHGVDTGEPEGIIKEAHEYLGVENYERAEELAKMAERIALHMEEKAEDISAGIKRLEGLVATAQAEGRETTGAVELLQRAKDLAKQGNYGASIESIKHGEKALIEDQVATVSDGLSDEEETMDQPLPGPPSEEMWEEGQTSAPADYQPGGYQEEQTQTAPAYDPYQQQYQPQVQQRPVQAEARMERFRCPHCAKIFEVRVQTKPVTTTCPYCMMRIMIA